MAGVCTKNRRIRSCINLFTCDNSMRFVYGTVSSSRCEKHAVLPESGLGGVCRLAHCYNIPDRIHSPCGP